MVRHSEYSGGLLVRSVGRRRHITSRTSRPLSLLLVVETLSPAVVMVLADSVTIQSQRQQAPSRRHHSSSGYRAPHRLCLPSLVCESHQWAKKKNDNACSCSHGESSHQTRDDSIEELPFWGLPTGFYPQPYS